MNSHDRQNLVFLLTATPDALQVWYCSATDDDLEYAKELLQSFNSELDILELESFEDEVNASNYSDANLLINKIKENL